MATKTKKKTASPEVVVSFTTFDTGPRPIFREVRSGKLEKFQPLLIDEYMPHGGTPLRDATAAFISHLESLRKKDRVVVGLLADESGSMGGNRAAVVDGFNDFVNGLREVEKVDPDSAGKVLAVIFTDGMENSSREISPEQLRDIVTEKEQTGDWTFIYLGANQDAWGVGVSMGLSNTDKGQKVNFTSSPVGTASAFRETSMRGVHYLADNASFSATYDGAMSTTSLSEDGDLSTQNSGGLTASDVASAAASGIVLPDTALPKGPITPEQAEKVKAAKKLLGGDDDA